MLTEMGLIVGVTFLGLAMAAPLFGAEAYRRRLFVASAVCFMLILLYDRLNAVINTVSC
jgi:hypothetical protein